MGLVCAWSALAVAEPLPVKHAAWVRVATSAQKAIGVHPSPTGGWRLELDADAARADIIDVTPGTPARTLSVAVVMRALAFDSVRFAAGHVYRVQLDSKHASLVYLYPDASAVKLPKKAGTQRVRFDDGDDAPARDDGMPRVDKGSL